MADQITKIVKTLSSIHTKGHSSLNSFATATANPKLFPRIALVVTLASCLIGYGVMEIVETKREKNMLAYEEDHAKRKDMSENEAVIRAMVENAKSSTMIENLENAAMAQKNFVMVPFDESVTNESKDQEFMKRIVQRSEEIKKKGRP